ncbi:MAG: hypothetical protein HPY90_14545 [Syntrophothermus sp.]|nr:hypothetical protein [Syntrophothermus sp.]NSW84451.1 hypothetical protein [Syntrophothermus sp.]
MLPLRIKMLMAFSIVASVLAAVDLYVIAISPYVVAGIAAAWLVKRKGAR